MRTIERDIVSALIFSSDGKLFMGRKDPSKGGVYVDCWHIPGGGIEQGEDMETALGREILEETGIDIVTYPVSLADDKGSGTSEKVLADGEHVQCEMKFNVFRVDIADQKADEIEVKLDDDLVEYEWFGVDNLPKNLTPPSVSLFERLGVLTK